MGRKATETLGYAYAYTRMRMHAQALCTHALCMHKHTRVCACMHARVPKTMKDKFSSFKLALERIPHRLRTTPNLNFSTIKP